MKNEGKSIPHCPRLLNRRIAAPSLRTRGGGGGGGGVRIQMKQERIVKEKLDTVLVRINYLFSHT